LGGGPGWHALVAGIVGVAAVAAGGAWRLAGPLVLGTGLLVAVTLHESLAALAGVPTWAWLATGGGFLLATGIALERSDTSPVEAGRRVVDVLSERFA
ncbi:MAG: SCO7613 C-terminal domain-containing membrane protein, partial [Acidimicrobiia bacterium]